MLELKSQSKEWGLQLKVAYTTLACAKEVNVCLWHGLYAFEIRAVLYPSCRLLLDSDQYN